MRSIRRRPIRSAWVVRPKEIAVSPSKVRVSRSPVCASLNPVRQVEHKHDGKRPVRKEAKKTSQEE